jgi:hypothetical protein
VGGRCDGLSVVDLCDDGFELRNVCLGLMGLLIDVAGLQVLAEGPSS